MPQKIDNPTRIPLPKNKILDEFIGRVRTGTGELSVAHMLTPPGWDEPFQTPAFHEVTIVTRGTLRVEHAGGHTDVGANEVILCAPGERIRYSNPFPEETEYWAICVPAFSPDTVQRDEPLQF